MKVLLFVSTLVLIAATPLAAVAAPRPNATMVRFFQSIEGHWTGIGTVKELINATDRKTSRLDADVQVRHQRGYEWSIKTDLRANGSVAVNEAGHEVRDNDLYVTSAGPRYPVRVFEVSPNSLSYRFIGAAFYGSAYEITYRLTLSGNSLRVHYSEASNGYPVREQSYMLRRF